MSHNVYLGSSFNVMPKKPVTFWIFFQLQFVHFIKYNFDLYKNFETRFPLFGSYECTLRILKFYMQQQLRCPCSKNVPKI